MSTDNEVSFRWVDQDDEEFKGLLETSVERLRARNASGLDVPSLITMLLPLDGDGDDFYTVAPGGQIRDADRLLEEADELVSKMARAVLPGYRGEVFFGVVERLPSGGFSRAFAGIMRVEPRKRSLLSRLLG